MSMSNPRIIVFATIGLLLCVTFVGIANDIKVNAQGVNNQSLNTTGLATENITVEGEDIVTPSPSNFTLESGTIITPDTSCRELMACVKVISSCTISSPPSYADKKLVSCDPIVGNLFTIFPYVYGNNKVFQVGPESGIEAAPSPGKMITFPVKENTSISYVIRQEPVSTASIMSNFFHIFQSANGCNGEIKAGETKNCYIPSTLYVKFAR